MAEVPQEHRKVGEQGVAQLGGARYWCMGSQGWGGAQVGLACVARSVFWAGRQPRRLCQAHTASRGGETKVGVLGRPTAGSVRFRGKRMVARWEGVV